MKPNQRPSIKPLDLQDVTQYVEQTIGDFHKSRLEKVASIDLAKILRSKNPYLFKAKNVNKADEIIEGILSAYISSSEEGIFGNWLERLAIFINQLVYNGQKAGVPGIDLDFSDGANRYLVTIKSGPDWGNDSQVAKMVDHFNSARKRLQTSGAAVQVICVNGCCYGRSRPSSEFKEKGNYYKKCGQRFWELISGDPTLYTELILPIGHEARERNDEFTASYNALVNKLTREFLIDYSDPSGNIDWRKLVIFNSSWPEKL
jgi:hypothetical protein